MTQLPTRHLDALVARCPELAPQAGDILAAYHSLLTCFRHNHTLFLAGNGGSCSDADHIAGELQKGFLRRRPLPEADAARLGGVDAESGKALASKLQCGLRAISLTAHTALMTAVSNDIGGEYVMAQGLYALGQPGDVLLAISTSGNAVNVRLACDVARVKDIQIIGLTGSGGGALAARCDVCIRVPASETFRVQEYHLPIYHALCAMVEDAIFQ